MSGCGRAAQEGRVLGVERTGARAAPGDGPHGVLQRRMPSVQSPGCAARTSLAMPCRVLLGTPPGTPLSTPPGTPPAPTSRTGSVGCSQWVFSTHQQSEDVQGWERCQGLSDTLEEHPGSELGAPDFQHGPCPAVLGGASTLVLDCPVGPGLGTQRGAAIPAPSLSA